MIFQSMFCGSVEMEENVWQGSVVVDIEFKVSVVLFVNFYEKMIYFVCYKKFLIRKIYEDFIILLINFRGMNIYYSLKELFL